MEVLSPVKNYELAVTAIKSGADAIYFSAGFFGARSAARNEFNEVIKIVEYAKAHYVKTYVTLNTTIYNDEIDLFINEARLLNDIGVDAIIIQDYAFISVFNQLDLDIHCSTQMNINNSNAALFVKNLGATRVVLPRELTVMQIKEIVNQGIETEVFVHGALCTSVSGICLISSLLNQNSGNRGKCNQVCRMNLKLLRNNEIIDESYMLSLKDLNVSNNISLLSEAGVTSIKIEGRLKQDSYVALTTNTYKKLVQKTEVKTSDLKTVYNRDFTDGFINETSSKEVKNTKRINNEGYYVGVVDEIKKGWLYVKCNELILHQDKVRFVNDEIELGQSVDVIEYLDNNVVRFKSKFSNVVGYNVYVVNSQSVKNNLKKGYYNLYSRKLYDIEVSLKLGEKIKVRFEDVYFYSDSALEIASSRPVTKEDVIKQFSKTKDLPFDFNVSINYESGFIRNLEFNKLRRAICDYITKRVLVKRESKLEFKYEYEQSECIDTKYYVEVNNVEQINELRKVDRDYTLVITDDTLYDEAKSLGVEIYLNIPAFIENDYDYVYNYVDKYDGVVVGELGALDRLSSFKKPVITNYTLNTTNIVNQQFLLERCSKTMLSIELDYKMVQDFNLSKSVLFLYGRVNMMVMKYCLLNDKKKSQCLDCKMCRDNKFHIELNKQKFPLFYQLFDKLALLSHKAYYNKNVLDYNTNYYIRFTDEEDVDILFEKIVNRELENYESNMKYVAR